MAWNLDPKGKPAVGRCKVQFQSLQHFAPTKSVTVREWEALARMAGELEYMGIECSRHDVKFGPSMSGLDIEGGIQSVTAQLSNEIRSKMAEHGLSSQEWTVLVSPVHSYLWPMEGEREAHEILWHVAMHLNPGVSSAKSGAVERSHSPTLAEQHGAAKPVT